MQHSTMDLVCNEMIEIFIQRQDLKNHRANLFDSLPMVARRASEYLLATRSMSTVRLLVDFAFSKRRTGIVSVNHSLPAPPVVFLSPVRVAAASQLVIATGTAVLAPSFFLHIRMSTVQDSRSKDCLLLSKARQDDFDS